MFDVSKKNFSYPSKIVSSDKKLFSKNSYEKNQLKLIFRRTEYPHKLVLNSCPIIDNNIMSNYRSEEKTRYRQHKPDQN
ncbi:unnamed protein product [Rhizophagus irregularis]|nr:unnamed protein product [Rhizophagus irregularis]CAB5357092.1 unnamed protein product [Rhizophagus irregularis]